MVRASVGEKEGGSKKKKEKKHWTENIHIYNIILLFSIL